MSDQEKNPEGTLKGRIEAILFVAGEPVSVRGSQTGRRKARNATLRALQQVLMLMHAESSPDAK